MTQKDNPSNLQNTLEKLLKLPENRNCADCGQRGPRWASTNLGIFICIKCAGLHRGMNTDFSKVKSVSMDKWTREQVDFMARMGNAKSNSLYEYRVTPSERAQQMFNMKDWIRNKYVVMKYLHRHPETITNTPTTHSPSPSTRTTQPHTSKPQLQEVPDLVNWGEPTVLSMPTTRFTSSVAPEPLPYHSHSISPVPQVHSVSPVPHSHAASPVPQIFEGFEFPNSASTQSSAMETAPTTSWDQMNVARPPPPRLDKESILKLYAPVYAPVVGPIQYNVPATHNTTYLPSPPQNYYVYSYGQEYRQPYQ